MTSTDYRNVVGIENDPYVRFFIGGETDGVNFIGGSKKLPLQYTDVFGCAEKTDIAYLILTRLAGHEFAGALSIEMWQKASSLFLGPLVAAGFQEVKCCKCGLTLRLADATNYNTDPSSTEVLAIFLINKAPCQDASCSFEHSLYGGRPILTFTMKDGYYQATATSVVQSTRKALQVESKKPKNSPNPFPPRKGKRGKELRW